MTGPCPSPSDANHRAATRPIASEKQAARNGRLPVARLLPASVLAALEQQVATASEMTPQMVEELNRRLGITEQYGLSPRRLRNHLHRIASQAESNAQAKTQTVSQDKDRASEWCKTMPAHRRRQASVATILDRVFGASADSCPELWERRAYLMLIGLVYERLATNEDEISTDELVKLAKVLAENRRVEARLHDQQRPDGEPKQTPLPSDHLPDNFAEMVRQVYGTSVHSSRQ